MTKGCLREIIKKYQVIEKIDKIIIKNYEYIIVEIIEQMIVIAKYQFRVIIIIKLILSITYWVQIGPILVYYVYPGFISMNS